MRERRRWKKIEWLLLAAPLMLLGAGLLAAKWLRPRADVERIRAEGVAWFGDGLLVASGSWDEGLKRRVFVLRARDRSLAPSPVAALPTDGQWRLSPDGALWCEVHELGGVRVRSVATGQQLAFWPAAGKRTGGPWPVDAAFSPDGPLLAVAERRSGGRAIAIYAVGTWRLARRLRDATYSTWLHVFWSPDGKSLATVADGGGVREWDAQTGRKKAAQLATQSGAYDTHALFTQDGRLLSIESTGLPILDYMDDERLGVWRGNSLVPIDTLSFRLLIRDVRRGRKVREFPVRVSARQWQKGEFRFCLSPDGRLLAVSEGGVLRVLEVSTGRVRREIKARAIIPCDWSRDGQSLAGIEDGVVQVWRL